MQSLSLAIVRRETLFTLFMAMELSWISALINLIQRLSELETVAPLAWATWLYPAAFLYIKAERRFAMGKAARVALRAIVGVLALIATTPALLGPLVPDAWPLAALALTAAFALVRGWFLAGRQIDTKGFVAGFQVGFVIFLLVVFLQATAPPDENTFFALIGFLGIGLFGLWLARWLDSDISARRLDQAGWPLLACAIIAAVLAAGMGIWTVLDHQGVLWLLSPVFWLWDLIIAFLQFLISLLPKSEPIEPLTGPPMAGRARPQMGPDVIDFFGDWVRPIGQFMFYSSTGGMLAAALFRHLSDLLRWMNRRRAHAPGITFERSAYGLMDDLRDILATCVDLVVRLWQRLLKMFGWQKQHLPRGERLVRETYARLVRWAARCGSPRAVGQTPYDFLPVLKKMLPEAEGDLTHLTECYVTVRYGGAQADPALIGGLKEGWARIRAQQRKI
ncbi:MAG: DUF4129 domain-containing protein, partial [Alphaproteobacteria bacterium]|nr:DUF4129 domain-containing protein [Alphaproteobacteria bacterium]